MGITLSDDKNNLVRFVSYIHKICTHFSGSSYWLFSPLSSVSPLYSLFKRQKHLKNINRKL